MSKGRVINQFVEIIEKETNTKLFDNSNEPLTDMIKKLNDVLEDYKKEVINDHIVSIFGYKINKILDSSREG